MRCPRYQTERAGIEPDSRDIFCIIARNVEFYHPLIIHLERTLYYVKEYTYIKIRFICHFEVNQGPLFAKSLGSGDHPRTVPIFHEKPMLKSWQLWFSPVFLGASLNITIVKVDFSNASSERASSSATNVTAQWARFPDIYRSLRDNSC